MIRITSDTTCDLGEVAKNRGIELVPLHVVLDDKVYCDGVDVTAQKIFDFVAETKMLPKTSAPAVEEYREFFARFPEDEIIHFNISSKASVSHNNAKAAAEELGGRVRVVDSYALSSGQGLLVCKAADLRDAGKSADEIVAAVEGLKARINTSFVPDRLDYLYKGGRCSKMEMYGANLLKIHPMIVMNDGALGVKKKFHGRMNVCIKSYIEELYNTYRTYDKTRCFITHSCADRELVDLAKQKVAELFDFDEVIETVAGSVITGHCGKGTLGVLFVY